MDRLFQHSTNFDFSQYACFVLSFQACAKIFERDGKKDWNVARLKGLEFSWQCTKRLFLVVWIFYFLPPFLCRGHCTEILNWRHGVQENFFSTLSMYKTLIVKHLSPLCDSAAAQLIFCLDSWISAISPFMFTSCTSPMMFISETKIDLTYISDLCMDSLN